MYYDLSMSLPLDPGSPVGFNSQGDMTPFTRFNGRGDVVPFHVNARGDIVPFEILNSSPDGTPSPFTFTEYGNRIPTVGEIYGDCTLVNRYPHAYLNPAMGAAMQATPTGAAVMLLLL
jgi:hypothetical protein